MALISCPFVQDSSVRLSPRASIRLRTSRCRSELGPNRLGLLPVSAEAGGLGMTTRRTESPGAGRSVSARMESARGTGGGTGTCAPTTMGPANAASTARIRRARTNPGRRGTESTATCLLNPIPRGREIRLEVARGGEDLNFSVGRAEFSDCDTRDNPVPLLNFRVLYAPRSSV